LWFVGDRRAAAEVEITIGFRPLEKSEPRAVSTVIGRAADGDAVKPSRRAGRERSRDRIGVAALPRDGFEVGWERGSCLRSTCNRARVPSGFLNQRCRATANVMGRVLPKLQQDYAAVGPMRREGLGRLMSARSGSERERAFPVRGTISPRNCFVIIGNRWGAESSFFGRQMCLDKLGALVSPS